MDLSVLNKSDVDSIIKIAEIAALRKRPLEDNYILIRIFIGGMKSVQAEVLEHAIVEVVNKCKNNFGLNIKVEKFTNDDVRNRLKWSINELIDALLESDIHIISTHVHQGNVSKTDSWNMINILSNIDRLEYHLGIPMGKHIRCPVFRQDKMELYKHLDELSAPTIEIMLNDRVSEADVVKISR
jgi:hypothetical protein